MSKWTHVSGLVRFDIYAHTKNKKQDKELVEELLWIIEDGALNNIPQGSEGPIEISVKVDYEVERDNNVSVTESNTALLSIHGNLRDFSESDFPIIEGWFKRLTSRDFWQDSKLAVRQAVLLIEDDSNSRATKILTKLEKDRFNE